LCFVVAAAGLRLKISFTAGAEARAAGENGERADGISITRNTKPKGVAGKFCKRGTRTRARALTHSLTYARRQAGSPNEALFQ
jgi:hypothetical protein